MARLHAITALVCAVALPLALGGCAGALVVGGLAAAGGAGYTAAQERGVNGAVDDFSLRSDVEKTLLMGDAQAGRARPRHPDRPLCAGRQAGCLLCRVALGRAGRSRAAAAGDGPPRSGAAGADRGTEAVMFTL